MEKRMADLLQGFVEGNASGILTYEYHLPSTLVIHNNKSTVK